MGSLCPLNMPFLKKVSFSLFQIIGEFKSAQGLGLNACKEVREKRCKIDGLYLNIKQKISNKMKGRAEHRFC